MRIGALPKSGRKYMVWMEILMSAPSLPSARPRDGRGRGFPPRPQSVCRTLRGYSGPTARCRPWPGRGEAGPLHRRPPSIRRSSGPSESDDQNGLHEQRKVGPSTRRSRVEEIRALKMKSQTATIAARKNAAPRIRMDRHGDRNCACARN